MVAATAKAAAAGAPSCTDELARCAGIAALDARVACYDSLAHRAVEAAAAPAPTTAAPAPTTAAPASAAAIAAQDPNNFGLTLAQQHMAFAGPTSVKARITAISSDPNGQTYIVLDSGQKWEVTDNDGWLSKGDTVTIKRAALGSFLLKTPANHSYSVRRVR
jgi:hypothetical protein